MFMLQTKPITEIYSQNNQELLQNIWQRTPIKINGLTKNWCALSWNFNFLVHRYGTRKIKILLNLPQYTGVLKGGQELYEQEMLFSEFVQKILEDNTSPCYLAYSKLTDLLAEEQQSFDFHQIIPCTDYPTSTRLWIGSANTCSGLHTDLKDNIFAQILGTKRVILIPTNNTHLVYPFLVVHQIC